MSLSGSAVTTHMSSPSSPSCWGSTVKRVKDASLSMDLVARLGRHWNTIVTHRKASPQESKFLQSQPLTGPCEPQRGLSDGAGLTPPHCLRQRQLRRAESSSVKWLLSGKKISSRAYRGRRVAPMPLTSFFSSPSVPTPAAAKYKRRGEARPPAPITTTVEDSRTSKLRVPPKGSGRHN